MSANFELLYADTPFDEADEDMPILDLSGIRTLGEQLTRLWKRLIAGALTA